MSTTFTGAKMAVYIGESLAVILRDDTPGLPYRNCWDLPGGGREGDESPLECALRECHEELGLTVTEDQIVWRYGFFEDGRDKWFFVAELPQEAAQDVVFGDEGQTWELMSEQAFLTQKNAVDFLQARLNLWIKERSRRKGPPLA